MPHLEMAQDPFRQGRALDSFSHAPETTRSATHLRPEYRSHETKFGRLRCNGSKGECFPQLFHKERDSVINIDRHVRTPVCAFLVFQIILHRATFPDLRASADHWTAGAPRPLCRSPCAGHPEIRTPLRVACVSVRGLPGKHCPDVSDTPGQGPADVRSRDPPKQR
jgi:hypothetical protein